MAYAKTVGKLDLYNLAKRNGVAMRTIAKYGALSNINSGLIGWWKFDEASGTTAADSSGNAITGTLVNTPSWVSGQINNALDFNGSSQYADLSNNSALAMGTGSFTFTAWINPDTITYDQWNGIFGANSEGASFGIRSVAGVGYLRLTKANNYDFNIGTAVISTGAWQHVAVVMDRGTSSLKYYLNGVGETITYDATTFTAGVQTEYIGMRTMGPAGYFDGKIDDARIYNRALSADDIAALYAVRPPNFIDGCAGPRDTERMLATGYGSEGEYWGQCITLAKATTITKVKFAVRKLHTPTGNVTAYLFATTGTVGANATGTGTALATSEAIAAISLPEGDTSPMVEFTFATPYLASAGGLWVGLRYPVNAWEDVMIQLTASSLHAGNPAKYTGDGNWVADNSRDIVFEVYGY